MIPKFIKYEKKSEIIKEFIKKNYNLDLKNFDNINYNVFPYPNLSIEQATLKVQDETINFKTDQIVIFLKIKNIYDFKNISSSKIYLNGNKVILDIRDIKNLIKFFQKQNNKFRIKKLDVSFEKDNKKIFEVIELNFSNYSFKKNHISGNLFKRKFKVIFKDKNEIIAYFPNIGIKAIFNLKSKTSEKLVEGSSKINLLKNIVKFEFALNENELEIKNSNFRSKDLKFSFDSLIKYNPFFKLSAAITVKEFKESLINSINLNTILNNKEIFKKFNGDFKINYKNDKFFTGIIDNYVANISLAHGRIIFSKNINILKNKINCKGDSLLIEEFPRLNFLCQITINNKEELLKKFSINQKFQNKLINVDIKGSINLYNKKISIEKINYDSDYAIKEEDMKYYEESFEKYLINEGFFKMFNKNKVSEFILNLI